MSQSIQPLKTYVMRDKVTDLREEKSYCILKGGTDVRWVEIPSLNPSNTSITFSAPPPSPGHIVDKYILLRIPIQFTFIRTVDDGFPVIEYGRTDAFKAYPALKIINTLTFTINNTSYSMDVNDIFPYIAYMSNDERSEWLNMSLQPTMLDNCQSYNDLVDSSNNVLGGYVDSGIPHQMKRGEFPVTVEIPNPPNNANLQMIVKAVLVTVIPISPLAMAWNEPGFYGVQNFTVNVTLGDLTKCWSHATNVHAIDTVTATILNVGLGSHSLFFHYITPSQLDPLPTINTYPYFLVQRYVTDVSGAVAAGASAPVTSNNIQLNSIPKKIIMFVRRNNATSDYTTTDTFFTINSVQISWENRSGLLSSATQQQLYQLFLKNGGKMTWAQWSGKAGTFGTFNGVRNSVFTVGSMVILEFGTDISLDETQAPGITGTFQLQVTVNYTNNSANAITASLYLIVVEEGTFSIFQNSSSSQIGVITKQEVLDAKNAPKAPLRDSESLWGMGEGGNLWAKFKNFAQKIPGFARQVIGQVQKGLPVAEKIVSALEGQGGALQYGGGAMMSRSQLKRRRDYYS